MRYTYQINQEALRDESGTAWAVYGIEAVDGDGNILFRFSDIFFSRERAEGFVRLCNEQEVELTHIRDIIDNAVAEQYTV